MPDDLLFAAPERLWALVAVGLLAVALVVLQVRRRATAARFADAALWPSVAPHRSRWRRPLATAVLLLATVAMTLGFAQPQVLAEQARERAVVVIAFDVSTSMLAEDVAPTRLEAAKEAATSFVTGLPAEVDVALVTFNKAVSVVRTATPDHDDVAGAIDALDISGGTAVGDAIAASLAIAEPAVPAARIVLLADGGSTVGRPVEEAVTAAVQAQVPVSTIAFGTLDGVYVDPAGVEYPVPVDAPTLAGIAEDTGGTAYVAQDAGQLLDAYSDIGTSVEEQVRRVDVADRFLGVALVLLLAGAVPSLLWFSRLV